MKYILLHGLGQTADDWKDTVQAIDTDSEILCPNLSEWVFDKEVCYDSLYERVKRYCNQFDEPLLLCGLSLGGILALQYAIEHSEKVVSLILIGIQYVMPKRVLKIQNICFRFMPKAMFQKMGFQKEDFISLCKSMMQLDFQKDLEKVKCPVTVVCGEKDKVNKNAAIQLSKLLKNAKLIIISDAGHEVNVDNPIALGRCFG